MFKVTAFALHFILIFWGTQLKAQYIWATPAVVDIDMVKDTFPYPVFMHARNYFEFLSKEEIIICKIFASGDNSDNFDSLFFVRKTEGQYEINACHDNCRCWFCLSRAPTGHISFYFKDGSVKQLFMPLKLWPAVKIEFWDSLRHPIDISTGVIKYFKGMMLHSKEDDAFYVAGSGIREDFVFSLATEDGKLLERHSGWHDSGHLIYRMDLSGYKNYKTIYGTLKARNDGTENLEISKYNPPVLKIIFDQ